MGTGLNAKPLFARLVAAKIAALTGLPFVSAPNTLGAPGGDGPSGVTAARALALARR